MIIEYPVTMVTAIIINSSQRNLLEQKFCFSVPKSSAKNVEKFDITADLNLQGTKHVTFCHFYVEKFTDIHQKCMVLY